MPCLRQDSANKADMMKDRALTVQIQANGEETELQSVSRHTGVPKKDRKKGKGQRGIQFKGRDTFKNSDLFHELSKEIKGLMNCL